MRVRFLLKQIHPRCAPNIKTWQMCFNGPFLHRPVLRVLFSSPLLNICQHFLSLKQLPRPLFIKNWWLLSPLTPPLLVFFSSAFCYVSCEYEGSYSAHQSLAWLTQQRQRRGETEASLKGWSGSNDRQCNNKVPRSSNSSDYCPGFNFN